MKVYSYIRVSTEDQSVNGVSLSSQEQKIKQYAELYDHKILGIFKDAGLSAKNLNRPGIQKILSMVRKKEIEGVIIAKLDRITRSVRDLAEIIELFNKNGVALISVGENLDSGTASGRMVLNMLATIAQWERETIGERTATALRFKRDSGQRYNKEPLFGFKHIGNRLEVEPKEQNTIDIIIDLFQKGRSYSSIATKINAMSKPTRSGGIWYAQQIKRIIQKSDIRKSIEKSNFRRVAA